MAEVGKVTFDGAHKVETGATGFVGKIAAEEVVLRLVANFRGGIGIHRVAKTTELPDQLLGVRNSNTLCVEGL